MKKRPRKAKRFTEKFVRAAAPGFYCDALTPTLNLLVSDTGSRRWVQRITIRGTQRNLGLGGWPLVTLEEARDAALDNRRAVRKGINPRSIIRNPETPPFATVLDDVLATRGLAGKTLKDWRQTLAKHASKLDDRPVGDITVDDVLGIIEPLWGEKRDTANKIRRYISAVMKRSQAKGYRADDPAEIALAVLPKNGKPRAHHKAAPYSELPEVLIRIRGAKAPESTRLGFEFLIQTAARTSEVLGATWDEIDFDNSVWTIPGERTKARRDHSIPLSSRSLEILEAARPLRERSNLIFPSSTRRGQIGSAAFQRILKMLGIDATPHGFRSSFRDWCAETGRDRSVSEAALAHVIGGTEGAYYRTKHFEQRRDLMKDWSEYIQ